MQRDVRVAVVGAGGAAQVVHLPILKRLPDLHVVGIVDEQLDKARTIAERFGVEQAASELGGLPNVGEVDAVLVCTPNDTHAAIVLEALEREKHVLCERPLAPSANETERLIDAAQRAERQLMVAMNQRFRFDVRALRQFVLSGELGEVFFARSAWLSKTERRPRRGWRRDPNRTGGGVLMDLGVQALDAALWTLGFPAVERLTARTHPASGVEHSAFAQLALEGGATLTLEASWELMAERDRHLLQILGTSGSASTAPFRVRAALETGLSDVTPPLDTDEASLYTASYRQEWAEFLRFVRGEKALEVQQEQVPLMRVLEACYRSAEEGHEVDV